MSKVKFAPAARIDVVRLTIAAVLAAALYVGLLSGPGTAIAAPGDTTCSNQGGGNSTVKCIGTINGNTVNVNITNIRILSDFELNVLKVELDKVFITVVNLPVSVQVETIAKNTVIILKALNVQVCQVKVFELGLVNLNIAKCEL
jgi:hypothetical protein